MKKTLLLIVGLCILAASAVFAQSYSIPAWRLDFSDNFQYGDNYQAKVAFLSGPLSGHQIKSGEEYTITMKFKLSRNMEQSMSVVIVDTTDKAKPNAWWTELSGYMDVGNGILKANQEYSVTFKLNTSKASSSAVNDANALVFASKGKGKKGTPNSGELKPFYMDVLEFKVEKK